MIAESVVCSAFDLCIFMHGFDCKVSLARKFADARHSLTERINGRGLLLRFLGLSTSEAA